MTEMHTWAGVLLGTLLFAVFWTGTVSVFDKEVDRWMMPSTRLHWDDSMQRPSLDRDIRPMLEQRAAASKVWTIVLPLERTPFLTLSYGTEEARKSSRDLFNPITMEPLSKPMTLGASGFIYPFHHNLTIRYKDIGAWLVGIAGMAMLCLLISGIVIHHKLFSQFFTLRLQRAFGRSTLDVHNVAGVALLPFHLLITLSGLIIAFSIYYPAAPEQTYSEQGKPGMSAERAFQGEVLGRERLRASGQPGELAALQPMVAHAEQHWGPGSVYLMRINNPKDANGNVLLRRTSHTTVTKDIDNFRFASGSGGAIGRFQASATVTAWNFIAGMHYIQFRHDALRWLYFLGGLGGCVVIATGLFFWTQARRKKQQRQGSLGVAVMDVLSIAGVCGVILATLAFFLANRWLPLQEQVFGLPRERGEVLSFYAIWLTAAAHALLRVLHDLRFGYLRAWVEQCAAIALLAVLAMMSNWLTTGAHLGNTLLNGNGAVAGMDLCLLAAALLALQAARKLQRRFPQKQIKEAVSV
ncbi:PepSY-associated TM helix domain-containing protein [Pseudomonas sp. HLT2-19-2]